MFRCGPVAQFQHIAKNGDFPARLFPQHRQRRFHGFRPCIVAVLDKGVPIGPQGLLATGKVSEATQPPLNFLRRHPQFQAHGHRRHGITDKVLAFQIHNNREALSCPGHPEAQAVGSVDDFPAPHRTALCRSKIHGFLLGHLRKFPKHGIVAV